MKLKILSKLITETEKKDLLAYLENKYSKREKIVKNERWLTLKRKKITKINIKGKNTIIITKRNHTYVKSDPSLHENETNLSVNNISSKMIKQEKKFPEKKLNKSVTAITNNSPNIDNTKTTDKENMNIKETKDMNLNQDNLEKLKNNNKLVQEKRGINKLNFSNHEENNKVINKKIIKKIKNNRK